MYQKDAELPRPTRDREAVSAQGEVDKTLLWRRRFALVMRLALSVSLALDPFAEHWPLISQNVLHLGFV